MIDKINGNNGYDFPDGKQNKKKNAVVRAYENTPGFEEAAKKRTSDVHKKNAAQSNDKDTGVILDLSRSETDKKEAAASAGRKKDMSWADVLRKIAAPILQWLKNFWESDRASDSGSLASDESLASNDSFASNESLLLDESLPSLEETDSLQGSDMPEASGRPEPKARMEEQEAVKKAALKSGSLSQIERLVTQNGSKRLAHNSDLLTYYDRRGKFVEMDETEKHRVLFGDKNILKL